MRPKLVTVPDRLWADSTLTEGAKALYCYLLGLKAERNGLTYAELRDAVGLSQASLRKHLHELEARGWIQVTREALRKIGYQVMIRADGDALRLPSDLLLDLDLPRSAKWVWGVIDRLGGPFDYSQLQSLTGFCHDSLIRYLRALRNRGWLTGEEAPQGGRIQFRLSTVNPAALRRQADIEELERGLDKARQQPGYSVGQYLAARMVRVLFPSVDVLENAELTGLDNIETGGRLHYDLLFPAQRVALEFHGPQHFGPTERFPSPELFYAQRRRDLVKLGLSQEREISLVRMAAKDLRFDRLGELLSPWLEPQPVADSQWHLYDFLSRRAALYRRAAGLA